MFDPTRDQARRFFTESWRKHTDGEILTPLEDIAVRVVALHPEYHAMLAEPDALERDFRPEDGVINPFLHLSLHLAIEEQLGIDQPPGIRAAFERCLQRRDDHHAALHDVLECLGETLFNAQRTQSPPDGAAYLACVRRRAGLP
ncbi:MAG: DUF1841 family protein [Rhodocyclaceae bacterium]